MEQMLRPLRITRVAGVIGPGTQPFPWIAIQDLCRAMEFIISTKRQAEFSTWWLRNKFHSMHLLRQWQHAIMLDEGGRTALVLPDAVW